MADNNWYVITGGPSTGKTTLLAELEKLGYRTQPEAARTIIDDAMAKGITPETIRSDEKAFQDKVAKLKGKVEKSVPKDEVTFFDRGMHDTLAYLRFYEFKAETWVNELLKKSKYRKVFLLERLPVYDNDYARTEALDFNDYIGDLLEKAYEEFDMKPIRVPAVGVKERVKFILDTI